MTLRRPIIGFALVLVLASSCSAPEPSAGAWCERWVAGELELHEMAENPNMDTPQSYWTSFERLHTETARFWAGLVEVAPPEIDANTRILADASEEFASHVRQLDPSSEDIADAFNSTTSADEVLDRLGVRRDMLNEESVTTKMSELESYADANCPERTRS